MHSVESRIWIAGEGVWFSDQGSVWRVRGFGCEVWGCTVAHVDVAVLEDVQHRENLVEGWGFRF